MVESYSPRARFPISEVSYSYQEVSYSPWVEGFPIYGVSYFSRARFPISEVAYSSQEVSYSPWKVGFLFTRFPISLEPVSYI